MILLDRHSPARRTELRPARCVAVGNFDGVHLGHRALCDATISVAKRHDARSTVLVFSPHPARVLAPSRAPTMLCTTEQQVALLHGVGIDCVAVEPFDLLLASLTPEQFVKRKLLGRLRARAVVVGENFAFGKGRAGNVETLERLGADLDFEVVVVPALRQQQAVVSSTRIRALLAEGAVSQAALFLGREHTLVGEVVKGAGRGSQIGVPTANIATWCEAVPKPGVYAVYVSGHATSALAPRHPAALNIGRAPTFTEADGALTIEAHLLDATGDFLGKQMTVHFVERLRDEQKFSGVEELVAQIRCDVERVRNLLGFPEARHG